MPVTTNKVAGPTTTLMFLGIEIDSIKQELRLPQEKITKLKALLREWYGRRFPSKHQLQVLIGHLSHAATVVKLGRIFIKHLIDTMKIPSQRDQKVHLNSQCQADIHWWATFIESWNGSSFFSPPGGKVAVVSDTSGTWDCRAFASWQLVPVSVA